MQLFFFKSSIQWDEKNMWDREETTVAGVLDETY